MTRRILFFGAAILAFASCKQDQLVLPTVATLDIAELSDTSVQVVSDLIDAGGLELLERGICYSQHDSVPTIHDFCAGETTDSGLDTTLLDELTPGTIYFLRAYASTQNGTGYGTTVTFKTLKSAVRPLEYFPVFPGSWWIYDNGDTLSVDKVYRRYIYCPNYLAEANDTLMLPYIKSSIYLFGNRYIKGYTLSNSPGCPSYRGSAFTNILSDQELSIFSFSYYWEGHQILGYTLNTDTSIWVNGTKYDHVLAILQYDDYFIRREHTMEYEMEQIWIRKDYFAKDIGLVLRQDRSYPIDTIVTQIGLKSYMIAK